MQLRREDIQIQATQERAKELEDQIFPEDKEDEVAELLPLLAADIKASIEQSII